MALCRLLGPQRVFDLQENMGGVNVSSGCAPAPHTQTWRQAPRGLRAAAARKVGCLRGGVWAELGQVEGGPKAFLHPHPTPRPPAAAGSPPRTLPVCHLGPSGPSEMPTSLGVLCSVTWSLHTSRHLPGTGKAGPGGVGVEGAPRLTSLLCFQVPPQDACPPSHSPRAPALRCPPDGQ